VNEKTASMLSTPVHLPFSANFRVIERNFSSNRQMRRFAQKFRNFFLFAVKVCASFQLKTPQDTLSRSIHRAFGLCRQGTACLIIQQDLSVDFAGAFTLLALSFAKPKQ
jgi:hypothetical protein